MTAHPELDPTAAPAPVLEPTDARLPGLYAALAKAQASIRGAVKDSENPFFRSRYADLASVWEACRAALTSNGLCVVQLPETEFQGAPEVYTFRSKGGEERSGVRIATRVSVRTRLGHASGESLEDVVSALLPSGDPQAVGSAITYLRRYGLAAMVGVAPEDDDGESTARPVPAPEDGPHVFRLPGAPEKWSGNGGKALPDVPGDVLLKVRVWLHTKDATKNAALVTAIDEELEARRAAETAGA